MKVFFDQKGMALEVLNVFRFSRADAIVQERARNFHALSLRVAGEGQFECDGHSFCVRQGELLYVPAGRGYRVCTGYEEVMVLHFNLWNYEGRALEPLVPQDSQACEGMFRRILTEWERRRPGSEYRCTAMVYELLAWLQDQAVEARCGEAVLQKIRPSLECLERRFADPELTVEELAACSAISSAYFRRLFRQAFGSAPQERLLSMRMRRAQELLASGYYSVSQVAQHSGFADAKYFSTAFRRFVGMPPRQYAQACQRGQGLL